MNKLPTLGVGIGFRYPFLSQLFLHRQKIDFLEIIAEHYLDCTSEKLEELDLLAAHFPIIPHGINLSLGSAKGLDIDYLEKMAKLIKRINPPYWSEHLCFTRSHHIDIGHLSPLPFTQEAINIVCQNINIMRQYIDIPFVVENIAYIVKIPGSEMTEVQFINEIIHQADCGLLLDVTNLYINSINHQYNSEDFINQLALERVVQLHFVGGHWDDDILIDSHSQPTHPEVWEIMDLVLAKTNVLAVVLERDENLPKFEQLLLELDQARNIGRKYQRWV